MKDLTPNPSPKARGLNFIKRLFGKRDRSFEITLKFTPLADGKCRVETQTGHNAPVTHALEAMDKVTWHLKTSLSRKAMIQGYDSNNPKTRTFMKMQRIGDLR